MKAKKKKKIKKPKTEKVVVEIEEHHSSMGTTHSYKTAESNAIYGLPCPDSLKPEAGKRFLVTWEELPRNPKNRPRKNPWREEEKRRQAKLKKKKRGR